MRIADVRSNNRIAFPLQEARERPHDEIDIDRVVWDPEYREEVRERLRRGD